MHMVLLRNHHAALLPKILMKRYSVAHEAYVTNSTNSDVDIQLDALSIASPRHTVCTQAAILCSQRRTVHSLNRR